MVGDIYRLAITLDRILSNVYNHSSEATVIMLIKRMIAMEGRGSDCELTHLWRDRQGAEGANPIYMGNNSQAKGQSGHVILVKYVLQRSNLMV